VNPAGLVRGFGAGHGGDATLDRTGGALRLAQFGLLIQSRNLAFGWNHNRYPSGFAANRYALALALGDEALSVGATRHWYRGGLSTGAWDVAVRARATPALDVSLVWRDIGSPIVSDTGLHKWPTSIIPAAGLLLLGGRQHHLIRRCLQQFLQQPLPPGFIGTRDRPGEVKHRGLAGGLVKPLFGLTMLRTSSAALPGPAH
jgi:hypothetical protein